MGLFYINVLFLSCFSVQTNTAFQGKSHTTIKKRQFDWSILMTLAMNISPFYKYPMVFDTKCGMAESSY